jgi:diaminopimelate decarboxylase
MKNKFVVVTAIPVREYYGRIEGIVLPVICVIDSIEGYIYNLAPIGVGGGVYMRYKHEIAFPTDAKRIAMIIKDFKTRYGLIS